MAKVVLSQINFEFMKDEGESVFSIEIEPENALYDCYCAIWYEGIKLNLPKIRLKELKEFLNSKELEKYIDE